VTAAACRAIAPACAALLVSACASTPPLVAAGPGPGIVQAAESMIGAPYQFGGQSPQGFDCSGLTQFAYRSAGIAIPRTAVDQQRAAAAVSRESLQPGDLVFFATGRKGIDHVGVYAGDGRFVHAPSSGRVVTFGYLADPWYAARYVAAGRFRSPGPKPATDHGTP